MSNKHRLWSLLTLTLLIAGCGRSEVALTTSPPATATTPSPASSTTAATSSIEGVRTTLIAPWGGEVVPGAVVRLMVPDGWSIQSGFIRKDDPSDPSNWIAVGASIVDNIWADRCRWVGTAFDPPVGPTVEDLATSFQKVWGAGATAPVGTSVSGFDGLSMVLTAPSDIDFADCAGGRFMAWRDSSGGNRWLQGPAQVQQIWLLDVEGVRLLIEATHFPELSTEEELAELNQVIDSIQIETE